ncbi:unnamed protein product [Candidula unifasciata]|uniref:Serine carboxypeptidase n=1 Tax=Candidula unifasciata TaxID=100452 RepID=A0A8S3ZEJ1_9EUPU|nr:unnamed protein product [Candidula unifasciata]
MSSYGIHLLCLLTLFVWCRCDRCVSPLLLTPFLDAGNITAALEVSKVTDSKGIVPKSFSGFITTDRKARNHLFFWFFPSSNDTNAPLMIWLNGGPTVSSMFGLFYENGPIRTITHTNGSISYERRPVSWADPFSMLYIDNPVGTGFSYSETNSSKTTQDGYSEELYLFIEQFYLMFPVYYTRELYIGGQSYAGKYVPAFAHQIHTRILEGTSKIPLTGIYLGGPYFDPLIQSAEFCEYYYSLGAISHSKLQKCKKNVFNLDIMVSTGNIHTLEYSELFRMAFSKTVPGSRDNYVTSQYPDYNSVEDLMRTESMKTMLHTCNLVYNVGNTVLKYKFKDDLLVGTKAKMAVLMNRYKILLYTGDYDGIITSPMVEAALMTTPWKTLWKLGDKLKGFYVQVGQFCRVVIHQAGHQTPHDQPESTLDMMIQFVQHGCIREVTEGA